MSTNTISTVTDLREADNGSWYTILGAGGDLNEWVEGVGSMLEEKGIGRPQRWYYTTGAKVNDYAQPDRWTDAFPPDLTILMFPLDGLDVGKLAFFRLVARGGEDKWFDDIIANIPSASRPGSTDDEGDE